MKKSVILAACLLLLAIFVAAVLSLPWAYRGSYLTTVDGKMATVTYTRSFWGGTPGGVMPILPPITAVVACVPVVFLLIFLIKGDPWFLFPARWATIAAGLLLAFNFALGSETVWSCLALGAVAVEVLLSAWLTRKL